MCNKPNRHENGLGREEEALALYHCFDICDRYLEARISVIDSLRSVRLASSNVCYSAIAAGGFCASVVRYESHTGHWL